MRTGEDMKAVWRAIALLSSLGAGTLLVGLLVFAWFLADGALAASAGAGLVGCLIAFVWGWRGHVL